MAIGIYKITNPNNRVYIGQSVNIEKRFYRYKILSANITLQTILYRSLIKYGVENHKFDIICECNESQLNEKERYYQEFYDSVDNGLNCVFTKVNDRSGRVSKSTLKRMSIAQLGNQNWLGKKHSKEAKQKISEAHTGRKHSKEVNMSKGRKGRVPNREYNTSKDHARSVSVKQYDRQGNLIKTWDCLMDIKREYGYHIGNISSCMNGRIKSYKNYIWERG